MLKYHCALVAPICLAIQFENGASKSLRKSKVLSLAIEETYMFCVLGVDK